MMATVRHVTSSSGLRKFQTDGFLFVGVYTYNKTEVNKFSKYLEATSKF